MLSIKNKLSTSRFNLHHTVVDGQDVMLRERWSNLKKAMLIIRLWGKKWDFSKISKLRLFLQINLESRGWC